MASPSADARLVAVTSRCGVRRVEEEAAGRPRLDLEVRVRHVLDERDLIGVADEVEDEDDGCVNGVLDLLRSGASEHAIAGLLVAIEQERMGLAGDPLDRLLSVASRLRSLPLPDDAAGRHS